jgi:hypothetical protein
VRRGEGEDSSDAMLKVPGSCGGIVSGWVCECVSGWVCECVSV